MFKFELGETVKDIVTDFKGVIVARTQYLTGCNRYSLQSKVLKDGKPAEWVMFDENQLKLAKSAKKVSVSTEKIKGGPSPSVQPNS